MFVSESDKSVKLNDDHYHPSRSKSDSQKLYHKKKSGFQSFNNFPELLDLPDTDSVY